MTRCTITRGMSFRETLKSEYETRCRRNPAYSLRAFARDLQLSPPRLLDVLSGRYGLSRGAAGTIASRLGFSPVEAGRFCDEVEAEHGRSRAAREAARARLGKDSVDPEVHRIQIDAFKAVSDWYHFAILELTETRDFKNDAVWIGRALGIQPLVASEAIERMKRLDLLEEKNGTLVATERFTNTGGGTPSEAVRKFHRQILEKAMLAIDLQSTEERELSAMVMSIDRDKLPEARKALEEFKWKFCRDIGGTGSKTDVYCLGMQFFRLNERAKK